MDETVVEELAELLSSLDEQKPALVALRVSDMALIWLQLLIALKHPVNRQGPVVARTRLLVEQMATGAFGYLPADPFLGLYRDEE